LTREFAASKYNLKFLIQAIVHTKAYQRSSEATPKMHKDDHHFLARMPVRGLSPEQLFDSILEATNTDPPTGGSGVQAFPGGPQPSLRAQFLARFSTIEKRTEMSTSILQALFLMNGQFLAKRTKIDPAMTMERLDSLPGVEQQEINASLHRLA